MHPLAQKITSLQHCLAWRERAVAACRIAATVIAAALLLGLVDYLVRFSDPGLRIMATAALAAAATWAAYRWWYLPSRRRLVPLLVARRVEARFPQLHDSLASALEFLQQSEDDRAAGSAQLRRLVVSEAEMAAQRLPLDDVIDRRPLRRAAGWLAIPLLVAAACLALDARAVGTAMVRLIAPIGSAEWPRQHHLVFREVPARIAAGQTFEVELVDAAGPLPDEVRVEYRTEQNGRREFTSEPMTRAGDTMIVRRENVRQSFAFRATGGDDLAMRWHRVEVIEPPQLESLEITIHPPAYTGLPSSSAERHLHVLAGTGIELHAVVNKPIAAARILFDGAEPIAATLGADPAGNEQRAFHVAPSQWTAAKSGPYRLEISDSDGVAVVAGQWNLRVDPDTPPSVSWQRPSDDLYVTPAALVPIKLAVKDNLAVQRVELAYERSDRSEVERERQPAEPRIGLFRGPERPAVPAPNNRASAAGENRVVEYDWDLAPLELPVGAELTIHAEAADYRPGIGRTIGPRHIYIITPEELEARLADRLAQIVRQLERSLAVQRTTREDVRRLEIQQREAGLAGADRIAVQSAELNQRRVAGMLTDPVEGVAALADSLSAEVEMNRVASSDVRAMLDRLAAELARLSSGPLDAAQRELTAARKAIEANDEARMTHGEGPNSSFVIRHSSFKSLVAAGAAQDDVIAALERLISELAGKADYRRFARLLAELRQDQIAHQQSARADIGLATLPLRVNELNGAQRANLNKAAAGQSALAARFEKIEQGMDRLAQELTDEENEAAGTLTDAVDLARRLVIGSKMQETARDLSENRVGQALERESQIADDLQQLLDILRRQQERRPEQLADKLRDAERRLAELREQLGVLRQQIAQAEQQPAGAIDERQLEQLHQRQQALRRDIERLARQLERLQAPVAGQSTQRAADRLDNEQSSKDQRPSPSQEVQQAEHDLEEAARQLAERRQQAEDDLALEFVRRFQQELGEMVQRQKRVLAKTQEVNNQRKTSVPLRAELAQAAEKLAQEEHQLAEKAREHSELLFGLGAVRVSLEDAERRLTAAAKLLDQQDTGPPTTRAERRALDRLEGMMQAFAQTANQAAQNQQPPAAPGAGAGGDQPPRRPTFELLEVKMLRMLQVDLNQRTTAYQQRLAQHDRPPDESQQAELEREAQELAAEQGRLAELVQNMLARDNDQ